MISYTVWYHTKLYVRSDFCYLPEEFGKNSKITFLEVKAWGTLSGLIMKDCYSRIAKVWTDLKLFLNQQIFTENLGFIHEFVVQSILTRRKFVFQQIPGVQVIRLYYFSKKRKFSIWWWFLKKWGVIIPKNLRIEYASQK